MKRSLLAGAAGLSILGAAHGEGLYYAGTEAQESVPLKWTVGATLTYDDNVNPTYFNPATGLKSKQGITSINPFAGVSFVSVSPQTTWDVYSRLGLIYYFDQPAGAGSDDLYEQARLGVNLTHSFNERLRFSSRSFVSYEREPDYSYGVASSAQVGEYFFWQTDNSVGYRFTERVATYTGITLEGINYDSSVPNADRFTWTAYEQFRYQLSPQTVLTAEYRGGETTGNGLTSDSTDQFVLLGFEHRLSPTTIITARAGAQFHDVSNSLSGSDTSPYVEATLNSQINTQFKIRAFARYGIESYDDVRSVFGPGVTPSGVTDFYEFTSRKTFRLGVSGDYAISQKFSIFGGVDYIPTSFDNGQLRNAGAFPAVPGPPPLSVSGLSEDLVNVYVGLSIKFTDILTGDLTYNYTDSTSDLFSNTYNRNRISLGVHADF